MPATAPSATAATPVAAMAAPTSAAIAIHAVCGSRHAGDCNLGYCRDSCRCHGSSHKCCHRPPCNLWEPACRRLQPPLLPRLLSLPWQLPQGGSAAIARHAICGSRHAGDCNIAGCRDSCRCHGSSHRVAVLPSPAMQSVGAGMPATATSQGVATPVAAMAAPTGWQCSHRPPCNLWEPACRRLQPPLLPRLLSLPWQLP